jgi:hypothetical protein
MVHARTTGIISLSVILTLAAGAAGDGADRTVLPLAKAHAHNDYHHTRPLLDALDHAFCSIEADVFLVDGALLVGHDRDELKPHRTLQSLYLDPLRERVKRNGGRVYRDGPAVTLLIDIKSEAAETYRAVHQILARYSDMLTRVDGAVVTPGAVTVVISGNRPYEQIAASSPRYAGIDGRLADLDAEAPAHLVPWISDNWGDHFRWQGAGRMPPTERSKLEGIVDRAHRANRRVRFWATPEDARVWTVLYEAGVDLINTDDLAGLQQFLESQTKRTVPMR